MTTVRFLIYGYTPSLAWNATLLALFAVSALVHSVQAWRSRYWIFYPTLVLGAIIEVMGYAARVWSSRSVYTLEPFLMQICLLIMAPVFFSAYVYVVLGTAIHRLGQQYSLLPPKWYFLTFMIADVVSLILQAVGGGQAASTASKGAPTQTATNIMVAGIIFQMCAMAVFIACAADFAVRTATNRPYAFQMRKLGLSGSGPSGAGAGAGRGASVAMPSEQAQPAQSNEGLSDSPTSASASVTGEQDVEKVPHTSAVEGTTKGEWRKWWLIMLGVLISSAMIFTRGIFRSIELSEGWSGHLVTTEIYQSVLDGIPMVIAVSIFNVIHPGMILGRKASWRGYY